MCFLFTSICFRLSSQMRVYIYFVEMKIAIAHIAGFKNNVNFNNVFHIHVLCKH